MNKHSVISNTTKFNNGNVFPLFGLGTSGLNNVEEMVYESVKLGNRLIDTAKGYGNEKQIGLAIKRLLSENLIKRSELFIITKLDPSQYDDPLSAIKIQLDDLCVEYVDLYLMHTPNPQFDLETDTFKKIPVHKVWPVLEEIVEKKLATNIGVSNFNVQSLIDLLCYCKIKPVCNEIEYHPYLVQKDLKNYCDKNGISIIAYNSLVLGTYSLRDGDIKSYNLLEEEIIKDLSKKYNKSCGLICLNWALCNNFIIIPKTSKLERFKENFEVFDFRLDESEIKKIDSLNCNKRFMHNMSKYERAGGFNIFA